MMEINQRQYFLVTDLHQVVHGKSKCRLITGAYGELYFFFYRSARLCQTDAAPGQAAGNGVAGQSAGTGVVAGQGAAAFGRPAPPALPTGRRISSVGLAHLFLFTLLF